MFLVTLTDGFRLAMKESDSCNTVFSWLLGSCEVGGFRLGMLLAVVTELFFGLKRGV